MKKNNLLIDEYPLLVLPSLAKAIGLNEAIALQQLHYWLNNPKGGVEIDGERWVYNTYEDWQKDNFPFWSIPTIQRVFAKLETMELVVSMQKAEYDRKKYYRIHYINLIRWKVSDCDDATHQDDTIEDVNLIPSLTETTTETTTLINKPALDLFKGYFGKFLSETEIHRWLVLFEATGKDKADQLSQWAFKKEIHLMNRGGLLDSLETAAKNWKGKTNRNGNHKTPVQDGVLNWLVRKEQELNNGRA